MIGGLLLVSSFWFLFFPCFYSYFRSVNKVRIVVLSLVVRTLIVPLPSSKKQS